ncbi:MAG: hypothetical protein DME53_05830 [Verrucomicrobia bacterium]|nr:MAG: hypothetical protein DME53_05830 [Verrucomicrobiota bacterium]
MAKKVFDQLRYAFGLLHNHYILDSASTSAIRRRNAQLSALHLIKYDHDCLLARYCRGIYECVSDG